MEGKCSHCSFGRFTISRPELHVPWPIPICSGRHYLLQKLNGESAKMNSDDICLSLCLLLLIWIIVKINRPDRLGHSIPPAAFQFYHSIFHPLLHSIPAIWTLRRYHNTMILHINTAESKEQKLQSTEIQRAFNSLPFYRQV